MKNWRPEVTAERGRVALYGERFARDGTRLCWTVSASLTLIRAPFHFTFGCRLNRWYFHAKMLAGASIIREPIRWSLYISRNT
jgi:hypothetical protein